MKATPPALDDAVFRPLGEAEGPALQRLLERCADFEIFMRGAPPAAEAAQELLEACPAGHPLQKKLVFGLERDGELIGALDLLRDYPETNDWYLGLLLFEPLQAVGAVQLVLRIAETVEQQVLVRPIQVGVRQVDARAAARAARGGIHRGAARVAEQVQKIRVLRPPAQQAAHQAMIGHCGSTQV